MKRKIVWIIVVALLIVPLSVFSTYWVNTQPVWINVSGADSEIDVNVPAKNKQIIRFIETEGEALAPAYNSTVCAEFVIRVISRFSALTKQEKNCLRIIVSQDSLIILIKASAYQIRGVQTALTKWNKGTIIQPDDVKSGDFVQFWNLYNGRAYGHCGVILSINPNQSITLYSSHPLTNGFGIQTYRWPDKSFL